MIFPRMYDQDHASAYESWLGGVEGKEVPYERFGVADEFIFVDGRMIKRRSVIKMLEKIEEKQD